jgi:hypothetical protein
MVMSDTLSHTNDTAFVISYTNVTTPTFSDDATLKNREEVTLSCQGKPIIIPNTINNLEAAALCGIAYKVSPEAIIIENQQPFLLWDHQISQKIRPFSIDSTIWNLLQTIAEKEILYDNTPRKIHLDLEQIWNANQKKSLEHFISDVLSHLKPATLIRITGDIPTLPLLAALCATRYYGKLITYTNREGQEIQLFT